MQIYRSKYIGWLLTIVLGLGMIVSGCGQKDDLYLPDQQSKQQHN